MATTVSLFTPPFFRGTITTAPSGSSYHVAPGETISASSLDLEFLLQLGFTPAAPNANAQPLTVTDGSTTITNIAKIDFTSNASVSSGGSGIANVSVASSGAPTVAAHSLFGNPGTSAGAGTNIAIGANLTLASDGTLSGTSVGGSYTAGLGIYITASTVGNTGTIVQRQAPTGQGAHGIRLDAGAAPADGSGSTGGDWVANAGASYGASRGGNFHLIAGGAYSSGASGGFIIAAGYNYGSGDSGGVTIIVNNSPSANAGPIQLIGGAALTNGSGSGITLTAGPGGTVSGFGGVFNAGGGTVTQPGTAAAATAGRAAVYGGVANATDAAGIGLGGAALLFGGAAYQLSGIAAYGARVVANPGYASGSLTTGGAFSVTGGVGQGAASNSGGGITLNGGAGHVAGDGGGISLSAGAPGTSSGYAGGALLAAGDVSQPGTAGLYGAGIMTLRAGTATITDPAGYGFGGNTTITSGGANGVSASSGGALIKMNGAYYVAGGAAPGNVDIYGGSAVLTNGVGGTGRIAGGAGYGTGKGGFGQVLGGAGGTGAKGGAVLLEPGSGGTGDGPTLIDKVFTSDPNILNAIFTVSIAGVGFVLAQSQG